eukprot:CFRG1214T1
MLYKTLLVTFAATGALASTLLYRQDFLDDCGCELDCRTGFGRLYHVGYCHKIYSHYYLADMMEGEGNMYKITKFADKNCTEEMDYTEVITDDCLDGTRKYTVIVLTGDEENTSENSEEPVVEDETEEVDNQDSGDGLDEVEQDGEDASGTDVDEVAQDDEDASGTELDEAVQNDNQANGAELECTSSEKSWNYESSNMNEDCGPTCEDVRCKDTNVECGDYGSLTDERCGLIVDEGMMRSSACNAM